MIIREPGKKHVGLFDIHGDRDHGLEAALGHIDSHTPDHTIIGGDASSFEWASHWNERAFADIGRIKHKQWFDEEMEALEAIIVDIRRAVGKRGRIIYIPGNHEAWCWHACFNHRFVEVPYDLDDITFKTDIAKLTDAGLKTLLSVHLHTKQHGVEVLAYNEPLKIGKITYLHGHQFSSGPLHNATGKRWPHCNLVIGHRHQHEVVPIFNQSDPEHYYEHVCVPALCDLAPGYEKDKSTRHSNGFWVCDFDRGGLFDGRVRKVFGGKMIPEDR